MNFFSGKYLRFAVFVSAVVVAGSCITDEFRFNDLTIKDDWGLNIVSPVFTGKMEFRDFIHDWSIPEAPKPGSKTTIDYTNRPDTTIETRLILDESIIVKDYPFLVQGEYTFTEATITFIVENECPLQLNLQIEFYNYKTPSNSGPPVSPTPFTEADFSVIPPKKVKTTVSVPLDDLQLESLNNGNRVNFIAWYTDPKGFLTINNTISAHYPVDLSIVLSGKAKPKQL